MSPLTFDQEQVQKLAEIGAQLRKIRTQKSLSMEDIATKTLIQQRFLEAIEKGQAEQLPEAVYVRGFIRRFAEALGIDGTALSEAFPLGRDQAAFSYAKTSVTSTPTLRPWHLYAIYVAAVLAAVTALYFLFRPQQASTPTAPAGKSVKTTLPKSKPSANPAAVQSSAKPKAPLAPVQAQLSLRSNSYLEITADGQSVYVGTLKSGSKKTVTAKQEIVIFSGNPGGVVLQANNQPAKVMGPEGQPKEVTLTPNKSQF